MSTKKGKGKARKVEARGGMIPLKRICQELEIDPKRARVKLRRAIRREKNPRATFHEIGSGRWDLTAAQAKEVRAVLSN